jgi:hypothetical protein
MKAIKKYNMEKRLGHVNVPNSFKDFDAFQQEKNLHPFDNTNLGES